MNAITLAYDLEAERALLGSILLDREAIVPVADMPDAALYLERHALIWRAMRACYTRREPADVVTVAAELRRCGDLDAVGGVSALAELLAETPTAVHVEYYAGLVRDCWQRRELVAAGGRIAALGYDRSRELPDLHAAAERELRGAMDGGQPSAFAGLPSVYATEFSRLQAVAEGRGGETTPTGYVDLDKITGGLWAGDLIILAARPGMGKTALALGLAANVARGGAPVRVFSLEMGREQLAQRLLAAHTGLDSQRLRTGDLRADEMARAVAGMGDLADLPVEIDDTPGRTIGDLRMAARRAQAARPAGLIVVDYLQLMGGDGRRENRVQEVSEISRGLKLLARELRVPVLALSQLSRAVEGRAGHVPMLSDLRESGSIEQDADIVAFLYREEVYDKATDKRGVAELHIAKHRNGPLGMVELRFEAHTTRFTALERYRAAEGYDDEPIPFRSHQERRHAAD